jgi:hypothetical protein
MAKKLFFFLLILLLMASATAGYFYWQFKTLKNNPAAITEKENLALVKIVGEIMLLPDETPTIATVTDPSKLSDQVFFANAKAGDKVLVYSLAKKAILYSPSLNKIIEVGPVNITDEEAGKAVETIPAEAKPKTTTE